MSDNQSFNICSLMEPGAMHEIAVEAQSMVFEAAHPARVGETIKAQLNRAARNLGYKAGDWRVKAAWYGEAGCWGAATFRDLERRFTEWKATNDRRERAARIEAERAASALIALRAAYASGDEDFHREQVMAIDAALAAMGVGYRPVDQTGG